MPLSYVRPYLVMFFFISFSSVIQNVVSHCFLDKQHGSKKTMGLGLSLKIARLHLPTCTATTSLVSHYVTHVGAKVSVE